MIDQLLHTRSFKDVSKNIDGLIGILKFKMREDSFTVIKERIPDSSATLTAKRIAALHDPVFTGGTGLDHPVLKVATANNRYQVTQIAEHSESQASN